MTADDVSALFAELTTIKIVLCLIAGALFASAMRPRK